MTLTFMSRLDERITFRTTSEVLGVVEGLLASARARKRIRWRGGKVTKEVFMTALLRTFQSQSVEEIEALIAPHVEALDKELEDGQADDDQQSKPTMTPAYPPGEKPKPKRGKP